MPLVKLETVLSSVLRQRIQMRSHSTGEVVAVGGVPVDRPRHCAANAGPGGRWLECTAVVASRQAIERGINDRGGYDTAASR